MAAPPNTAAVIARICTASVPLAKSSLEALDFPHVSLELEPLPVAVPVAPAVAVATAGP